MTIDVRYPTNPAGSRLSPYEVRQLLVLEELFVPGNMAGPVPPGPPRTWRRAAAMFCALVTSTLLFVVFQRHLIRSVSITEIG